MHVSLAHNNKYKPLFLNINSPIFPFSLLPSEAPDQFLNTLDAKSQKGKIERPFIVWQKTRLDVGV